MFRIGVGLAVLACLIAGVASAADPTWVLWRNYSRTSYTETGGACIPICAYSRVLATAKTPILLPVHYSAAGWPERAFSRRVIGRTRELYEGAPATYVKPFYNALLLNHSSYNHDYHPGEPDHSFSVYTPPLWGVYEVKWEVYNVLGAISSTLLDTLWARPGIPTTVTAPVLWPSDTTFAVNLPGSRAAHTTQIAVFVAMGGDTTWASAQSLNYTEQRAYVEFDLTGAAKGLWDLGVMVRPTLTDYDGLWLYSPFPADAETLWTSNPEYLAVGDPPPQPVLDTDYTKTTTKVIR